MRCPVCGTTRSDVLETRKLLNATCLKRSRLCHNGHRYKTVEVNDRIYGTVLKHALPSAVALARRDKLWKRNQMILKEVLAGAKVAQVAKKYHLSERSIFGLLKQQRATLNERKQK